MPSKAITPAQMKSGLASFKRLAMGPKSSDMVICKGTPEQKAKLEEIKKDLLSGKIKVLDA